MAKYRRIDAKLDRNSLNDINYNFSQIESDMNNVGSGGGGGESGGSPNSVSKTGDTMTGPLKVPTVITGSHTFEERIIEGEDSQVVSIERDGEHYTILEVVAPREGVSGNAEATLTLMRQIDPDTGMPDFLDLYNMNYPDAKQMGVRVQTRGLGILRDFVFEFNGGKGIFETLRIKPNKTIEVSGDVIVKSNEEMKKVSFQDVEGNEQGFIGRNVAASREMIALNNVNGKNSMELHDNGSFVVYSAEGDYYVYLDSGRMFVNDSPVQTIENTSLTSPDGSSWVASIDNDGNVTWSKS